MKVKKDVYQEITNKIIELLELSLIWEMPWVMSGKDGLWARNAISNKPYSGINQMLLSFEASQKGYDKLSFLTFNQIKTLGGTVRKGEKSSPVYFYSILYFENGKKLSEEVVSKLSIEEINRRDIQRVPYLKHYSVFNVSQTEGLPENYTKVEIIAPLQNFQKNERAEQFLKNSGAVLNIKACDKAYYHPATDSITLPLREQFVGEIAFYETALHELGHWTGHPTRMNRDMHCMFGSEKYAKEELIAELFSAFACSHLGFVKPITNNAAYIQNWISVLKNDHKFILKASKEAERALAWVVR